ncbi:MAG: TonB-dependent siderophore receptor, partial [Gammaproteobacteria bacterium]
VNGDLDTAVYERVEVVRGATGLTSSTGNPSASVNFVRKRPLATPSAALDLTLDSWDARRLTADLSTPLNASGSVKGRAVLVAQDGDSWLDRYHLRKGVGYGVVTAQLSPQTAVTVGHLTQDNRTRGGMWGALPLHYQDGTPTAYARSVSTSADWSRWDTRTHSTFAELTHTLAGWRLAAVASHQDTASDAKLQYVYGTPERGSEAGLFAYPSAYQSRHRQSLLDLSASGAINLAGRTHEVMLGAAASRSRLDDQSRYGRGIGTELTREEAFGGAYPEPRFDASVDGSSYQDKRRSAYAAVRWNLAERVKLLTGANTTHADGSGTSYGMSKASSAGKTNPYAGIVVELTPAISTYASYIGIFNPQSETGLDGSPLAPATGSNAEAGFKADLGADRLHLAGAVFRTRQRNIAEQAGMVGVRAWYRGIDAEATGAELELSGELARGWQASVGLTHLRIENEAGEDVKTYVPRTLLRAASTWRPAALPNLKLGASLTWQSAIERAPEDNFVARQGAYAVLGLMGQYAFNERLTLAVNLNNATNRRYLTSLYWSQAYYAAPRNGSATLSWTW